MIANFFRSLNQHRVECLLISGQATVLYGAAHSPRTSTSRFIRELPQHLEIMPLSFRASHRLVREHGFHLAQEFFWYNPAKLPASAEWVWDSTRWHRRCGHRQKSHRRPRQNRPQLSDPSQVRLPKKAFLRKLEHIYKLLRTMKIKPTATASIEKATRTLVPNHGFGGHLPFERRERVEHFDHSPQVYITLPHGDTLLCQIALMKKKWPGRLTWNSNRLASVLVVVHRISPQFQVVAESRAPDEVTLHLQSGRGNLAFIIRFFAAVQDSAKLQDGWFRSRPLKANSHMKKSRNNPV